MILAKYLGFFVKTKQKAYFHIITEMFFATSEFYGKAVFIMFCVHTSFFLTKWFTKKKKNKQFVIWPVVLSAPKREG